MIAKRLGSASAAWIDARRAKAEVVSILIESMVAKVLKSVNPIRALGEIRPRPVHLSFTIVWVRVHYGPLGS
jgi:hypothetical protein